MVGSHQKGGNGDWDGDNKWEERVEEALEGSWAAKQMEPRMRSPKALIPVLLVAPHLLVPGPLRPRAGP